MTKKNSRTKSPLKIPGSTQNLFMQALDNFVKNNVEPGNLTFKKNYSTMSQFDKRKFNQLKEVKDLISDKNEEKFDLQNFLRTLNPEIAFKQKQEVIVIISHYNELT